MIVKYSYVPEDADELVFELKSCGNDLNLRRCYFDRLSISTLKYKDLQKLFKQNTIPEEFQDESIKLKHSNGVMDCLNDTDEVTETNN